MVNGLLCNLLISNMAYFLLAIDQYFHRNRFQHVGPILQRESDGALISVGIQKAGD